MMKLLFFSCVLLCIILSVHSFLPDKDHVNDCYHPVIRKYIPLGATIQTGQCSIATCNKAPFDIEETLCECGPRKINYGSGCYMTPTDYSKDYPACCERPTLCV